MSYQFTNDYSALACKEVLEALLLESNKQNKGYGYDIHTTNAEKIILNKFNVKNGKVFLLSGGTQANMVVISYLLKPYEGVICCNTGHINVHETGAVEGSGHKVYTVPNVNGKLLASEVEKALSIHQDEHMIKPKMVYISNSTETGTIYSKQELLDLRKVCDKNDMYLFIDGARLGAALTSKYNDVTCELIGQVADVFYVGGTKNGLLSGEAVVFKNKEIANEFKYHIKNKGALLAKGFVLGIQFETIFKNDLYFDLARHSNEMASYIKESLNNVVTFTNEGPTNQLFVKENIEKANKVIEKFGCEFWEKIDANTIIFRIVTSFNTTKEDCDELINFVKSL